MRGQMLNFEEELKKFHSSPEVGDLEDAVYNHDLSDLTDLLVELEKGRRPVKARPESL